MAVVPNVDTLAQIAGVGGWAGMYHGLSLYLDETPLTPTKMAKIVLLPIFWGSLGITGFMVFWLSLQSSLFVVGNMLRPFPFVLHMMVLSGIFVTYMGRKAIRDVFFMTPVEVAVAEQTQDRADQAQAEQGEEEAEQGEEEAEQGEEDEEEDEEDGEGEEGEEGEEEDDATTLTGEAHEQEDRDDEGPVEPQQSEEEVNTLVAEIDRLMETAGPVTSAETETPGVEGNVDAPPGPVEA